MESPLDHINESEFRFQKNQNHYLTLPKGLVANSEKPVKIELNKDLRARLNGLIELNNLIHRYLVFDAVDKKRDTVVSCYSIGNFFLIIQLIDRVWPEAKKLSETHHKVLAWWMSVLLDDRYTASSAVEALEQNIFLKYLQLLDDEHIRDLLQTVKKVVTDLQNFNLSAISSKRIQTLEHKISTWCSFHTVTIPSPTDRHYCNALLLLCLQMQFYIEQHTGMRWSDVCRIMNDLYVVQIEVKGEPVLLTTRPTAKQLSIQYSLCTDSIEIMNPKELQKPRIFIHNRTHHHSPKLRFLAIGTKQEQSIPTETHY